MLLLDTNVLYTISEVDKHIEIDIVKLKSFLSNKDCCFSPITIFEIFNNKHYLDECYSILFKTKQCCKSLSEIQFFRPTTAVENNIQYTVIEWQKIKVECEETKNKVIDIYSLFYGELFSSTVLAFFYLCLFLKERSKDIISEDVFIKKFEDNYYLLNDKIVLFLKRFYKSLIRQNEFTEKQRNLMFDRLILNISFFLRPIVKNTIDSLNNNTFSYSKMFSKLKTTINKMDLDMLYCKEIRFNYSDLSLYTILGAYSGDIRKQQADDIVNKVVKIFTKTKYKTINNPFVDNLFKQYLEAFIKKGCKRTNNDILDALITDSIYYSDVVDSFMVFDNSFKNGIVKAFSDKITIISKEMV